MSTDYKDWLREKTPEDEVWRNLRNPPAIVGEDRRILRDLARQVAEIGHLPEQLHRRERWRQHHRLKQVKPMVLCFPEGSWVELIPKASLVTRAPLAREYEWRLRHHLFRWEHLRDDNFILPRINVHLVAENRGWGVAARSISSGVTRGAVKYDPPLKEPSDFEKMRFPEFRIDWEETQRRFEVVQDALGDILEVRTKRLFVFDTTLTDALANLRGAEQLMLDMSLRPGWLHEVLSFMAEGTMRLLDRLEAEGALALNNDDDYVGSGGVGATDLLPAPGFDGQHVRTIDLWGHAASQQYALVSPAMHEEFGVRYQKQLLARFGLNCYGCCESLSTKWHLVKQIPNLRRISVSPWANVWTAAEALGDRFIFSWKPNPAHVILENYAEVFRETIAETLRATKGCVLEMILKDCHTCNHQPERLGAWVRIANELTADVLAPTA